MSVGKGGRKTDSGDLMQVPLDRQTKIVQIQIVQIIVERILTVLFVSFVPRVERDVHLLPDFEESQQEEGSEERGGDRDPVHEWDQLELRLLVRQKQSFDLVLGLPVTMQGTT